MNRRSFLGFKEDAGQPTYPEFRTTSGIDYYAPPFGLTEKIHLLKRVLFGVKQKDIDLIKDKNLDESLNLLLNTSPEPLPPLNNYNDTNFTDSTVPTGQSWVKAPYDGNANGRRITSFKSWWTGLMLNQGTTIHEKMVLFWHNHFATETVDINDARYIFKHNALLRAHALGNFRQLVREVTLDPAMLRYLNGYLNNKNSPDENYAREL